MTNATLRGKPDVGNPHFRFDEGEVASAKPRRGSLLYKLAIACWMVLFLCVMGNVAYSSAVFEAEIPSEQLNSAGLELLATCCETNRGTPVLISPFSIDSAFALLWLGSSAPVQAEISGVLGFSGDVVGLASANRILSGMQEPRILTANSLWVDRRFPIADSYLTLVNRHFTASVFAFDNTQPASSVKAINDYVARNTQDMIKDLLQEGAIKPYENAAERGTGLVLLNTLYFNGKWQDPFKKRYTMERYEFNSLDGRATDVQMMRDERRALYGETPDYQVLALPYKGCGGACKFVAVLPTPRLDVEKLIKRLSEKCAFDEMLRTCSNRTVRIKLPKLDFEFKTSLMNALMQRGLKMPFTSSSSFAAITEGKDGVYADRVSEVIHATRIKMDEEATEAAAATAIVMTYRTGCVHREPPVPEFTADHPYLAFILDDRTDLMLFAGVVRNIGTNPHKGSSRDDMEKREAARRAGFQFAAQEFEDQGPKRTCKPKRTYIDDDDDTDM